MASVRVSAHERIPPRSHPARLRLDVRIFGSVLSFMEDKLSNHHAKPGEWHNHAIQRGTSHDAWKAPANGLVLLQVADFLLPDR
jgi:hypothetical protein